MLLKENKVTNNKNEMLLGLMDNIQYPSFNFHFNRPICVSKISIWNFNGFGDDLCYGIKKLKIYADNKLVWLGKIPCGNGKKEEILYSIKLYQPNTNVNEFKVWFIYNYYINSKENLMKFNKLKMIMKSIMLFLLIKKYIGKQYGIRT